VETGKKDRTNWNTAELRRLLGTPAKFDQHQKYAKRGKTFLRNLKKRGLSQQV